MNVRERAVQVFVRERLRYVHDQRQFAESKGWKWDKYMTQYHLNHVQDVLASDPKLAEQYLEVYELGRDWGADCSWVGNQIRLQINRDRALRKYDSGEWTDPKAPRGLGGKPAPVDRVPSADVDQNGDSASASDLDKIDAARWETDQVSDSELERYEKKGLVQKDYDRGLHPHARLRGRGGGTRQWDEFEQVVTGFIMDAGGANVRPGEQMPKEIVRRAHDMAVAHEAHLERLAEKFPFDAITHADLLIVGYPMRLKANVQGVIRRDEYGNVIGSRMDRGTKRLVDALQHCEGCGLPFVRLTKKGNPDLRAKTCDRECWNLKRRNLRAKRATGAAT